jgi:hypothetical protein
MKATYGNRTYKRVMNRLLRRLMVTLMTGKAPSEELPDKKLTSMLRKTESQLVKDGYGLCKAWYEKQVYSASPRTAASHWNVKPAEVKYLDDLWIDLRYSKDEYRRLIDQSQVTWPFDVDETHEEVVVWLDDKAIEDIVLVALEAYAVPKKGARFTETYGICFGSIKATDETRQAHGKHTTRYIHVSSVHIQLRAEGFSNKVTYDLRSLETQMAVARHLFPQLDIVGDFHTHPYRTVEEMRAIKGWHYSGSDEACIPAWAGPLRKMGYHPRASLIVGVATGGRKIAKPGRLKPNLIRFSINKYHFYIASFRIIGNRYSDRNITLYPISLFGT